MIAYVLAGVVELAAGMALLPFAAPAAEFLVTPPHAIKLATAMTISTTPIQFH